MSKRWLRIIGVACVFLPFLHTLSAMLTMFTAMAGGEDPVQIDLMPYNGLLAITQLVGVAFSIWSFFGRSPHAQSATGSVPDKRDGPIAS